MIKKITAVITALSITAMLCACRDDYTREGGAITTADIELLRKSTETVMIEDNLLTDDAIDGEITEKPVLDLILDREGTLVEVPLEVNRIVSGSDIVTELLIDLGLGQKIVAADKGSASVKGIAPSICTLNKKIITASALTDYEPDVVILGGNSSDNVYNALKNAGVNVICIPESTTIESVKLDIEFLSQYLSVKDRGQEIIDEIDGAVIDVTSRLDSIPITQSYKVYFEAQSLPELKAYSNGTLAMHIVSIAGGTNALEGADGIISVLPEDVISANPDTILITASGDADEINSRTGWSGINAVKNGRVHIVKNVRPTASIVDNIYEIAKAIRPELYKDDPTNIINDNTGMEMSEKIQIHLSDQPA